MRFRLKGYRPSRRIFYVFGALILWAVIASQREQHTETPPSAPAATPAAAEIQQQAEIASRERETRDRTAASLQAFRKQISDLSAPMAPPLQRLTKELDAGLTLMAANARNPAAGIYGDKMISPEAAYSSDACSDPAGTLDMLDREGKRRRNILACGSYYSLHRADTPPPTPQVMIALLIRNEGPDEVRQRFPLPVLIYWLWSEHFQTTMRKVEMPDSLPAMTTGETYNIALLRGAVTPNFARRMFETAATDEKVAIGERTYPMLTRLRDAYAGIVQLCKTNDRSACAR